MDILSAILNVLRGATDTTVAAVFDASLKKLLRLPAYIHATVARQYKTNRFAGRDPQSAAMDSAPCIEPRGVDFGFKTGTEGPQQSRANGHRFFDVVVQATRPGILLVDQQTWVRPSSSESGGWQRRTRALDLALREPNVTLDSMFHRPIVPLTHWTPLNWFHFLVDMVPLIWRAKRQDDIDPIFVIPATLQASPNHQSVLELALAGSERKYISERSVVRIPHCFVPNDLNVYSHGSLYAPKSHVRAAISDNDIADTRQYADWLQTAVTESRSGVDVVANGRRLFLARPGETTRRRQYNQDAVFEHISHYGFEWVDFAAVTPNAQARAIGAADLVVGTSGAAFANMLFARPGTTFIVIGWSNDLWVWQNLGTRLGLTVHLVFLRIPDIFGGNLMEFWVRDEILQTIDSLIESAILRSHL